jgi:hypothetical protein
MRVVAVMLKKYPIDPNREHERKVWKAIAKRLADAPKA